MKNKYIFENYNQLIKHIRCQKHEESEDHNDQLFNIEKSNENSNENRGETKSEKTLS